ncbi:cyclic nucleotide-gated ion channel [Phreatobacter cathodiphilus]|uniref:Cyclic nucleotide-binding protein n=1 Tax=Phreatobacter cathodiphilus TaxID=1868589 RepID=A0A2S0NBJ0_9HYPH|nr:cyclic nucleotide-gated ion channel [Phreatobacter cathodiphilus]AVO45446.1 cyclic nucleotide-binding protein [Phreatobacter cathodiphilus]
MAVAGLRRRVYELLDKGLAGSWVADLVHGALIALVIVNVAAVVLESMPAVANAYERQFRLLEIASVAAFTLEYVARLWVAPDHPPYRTLTPLRARLRAALSPALVIDLLAIVPFYVGLLLDMDLRFLLLLRLVRFFKLARYSPGFASLVDALWSERRALGASLLIFLGALVIVASAMRLAEQEAQPDKFATIPDALWWAVITLTTVGYGDVYPVTGAGKLIAGVTAVLGIVMLALPVGIIATAFAREIQRRDFVVTWSMVSGVPLFSGLDAASVAEVMRALTSATYEPGALICRAGQPARAVFVIAEGEVEAEGAGGRRTLGAGQCFGEAAVLQGRPMDVTVRATSRVKVLALDADELHHLRETRPALGVVIAAVAETWESGEARDPAAGRP